MNETRRFLRFVIPGLVFLIEFSTYFLFSAQDKFLTILKNKEWMSGIAFPIAIFIVSGGIGFLLTIVFYAFYRIKFLRIFFGDYKPFIEDCIRRNWLSIKNRSDNSDYKIESLSHSESWRIITAFWHERRESSERIKGASPRTDSLADITQGLGATIIGSLLAACFWIYFHLKLTDISLPWFVLILAFLIILIHIINYYHVRKDLYSIVEIVMTDELKEESNEGPVEISIS